MFPVNFEKERAERFLRCLAEGEPIGIVQTIDEMLALAGACFFVMSTHGPLLRTTALKMAGESYKPPTTFEHQEAETETVFGSIHGGIEWAAQLTGLVCDGEYDAHFEPKVQSLAMMETGNCQVKVVTGGKKAPPITPPSEQL